MDETNRLLRERFDNIDAKELVAMQERHEEESFNLDFKRINPTGELSDDDKGNLRKAISGFANSAGGIILWGVDTKKAEPKKKGEPEDRSRFQSLVPIANGDRVAIRFHELTATATQPAVSGVVHREIKVDGGFIIKTFVPASDGGPHRTNETNGQYYRRDADAFRAMQHHEIADMFGRRARPQLEFYTSRLTRPRRDIGRPYQALVVVGIRNIGRGLARFPKLVVHAARGCAAPDELGLNENYHINLQRITQRQGLETYTFVGGDGDVIHSGDTLEITKFKLYRYMESETIPCLIHYAMFAEGMPPVRGSIEFKAAHFDTDLPYDV